MSYSLSFKLDKAHGIFREDMVSMIEDHIQKDLVDLFAHYKIIIISEDVHCKDIPYAPKGVSGLIGINIHAINFGMINTLYYNHIIKYYSRLYGEKEYVPFSDKPLSYFYFDEEKTYLVPNELFEETQMFLYSQNTHISIAPENPFLFVSKPKMRNFLFNRQKKKVAKLLNIN